MEGNIRSMNFYKALSFKALFIMLLVLCGICYKGNKAFAQTTDNGTINVTSDTSVVSFSAASIYVGDTVDLKAYESAACKGFVKYEVESGSGSSVNVTAEGILTATSLGTTDVKAIYTSGDFSLTDVVKITVVDTEEFKSACGANIRLNLYNTLFYKDQTFVGDNTTLKSLGDGRFTVDGFSATNIYVIRNSGDKIKVGYLKVKVPKLAAEEYTRAIGTGNFLPDITNIKGSYGVSYTFSNNKVCHCNSGYIVPDSFGTTKVTMYVSSMGGQRKAFTFTFNTTNPKLKKKYMIVAVGGTVELPVTGVVTGSSVGFLNTLNVTAEGLDITGETKGTKSGKIVVDGKPFKFKFIVNNPHFNDMCIRLYPGKKLTIPLKGTKKKSNIEYALDHTKYVKLSGSKVKGKKCGNSYLRAEVDGKSIFIQVAVTTKTAYKAVNRAIKISKTKTHYSQARRMSKGLYDCSSLVYRCYKPYGVRFGQTAAWAPTAAGIGYWCTVNKKILSYRKITDIEKLLPGDLIFFAYAGNNGRYRFISHIQMYVGGGQDVSASSSYNRVIKYGTGAYNNCVVLVARPTGSL
ncbi:MAG: C40 family peptidase [Lachnospiraceae bacterium]|nr:C40 family peptidase [Lachnospiraceae bacterium]